MRVFLPHADSRVSSLNSSNISLILCIDIYVFLKPALTNGWHVMRRNARPRVALKVKLERNNVMEPIGRQIQDLTRLHDNFVADGLGKFGELVEIGLGPVNG